MPRQGTVVQINGDRAVVSTEPRGICADCVESGSCSFDQALSGGKSEEVTVLNPLHARVGDLVEFDLVGHMELKLSLLIWAVPLAGLILGAALGAGFHTALGLSRDPATLLGALTGLGLAFAGVRVCDRRAVEDPRLVPRIQKVISLSCRDKFSKEQQ